MRKRNIITNNKEVYEKLSMLNFSNEVILNSAKPVQIEKIINNINKKDKILTLEEIGDYFLVKKVGKINFNIYLR